jgi:hypothetical protein
MVWFGRLTRPDVKPIVWFLLYSAARCGIICYRAERVFGGAVSCDVTLVG